MKVPLASGDAVIVEVDRQGIPSDLVLASNDPYAVAVKATETLDQVLGKVEPALQAVGAWARSVSPDECCVEFGLKLGGETGIIIAKGTASVNFVVKLTWKNQP
jgi:Trypsin-co-occurring domain 1